MTLVERIATAICLESHPATRDWAVCWLSGDDRSLAVAKKAARAAALVGALAAEWAALAAVALARSVEWRTLPMGGREERVDAEAAEAAEAAEDDAADAVDEAMSAAGASRFWSVSARARAILAGEYPAERFDEPFAE